MCMDGESLATGIATAVVDASVEECAAYEFYVDSRIQKDSKEQRGSRGTISSTRATIASIITTKKLVSSSNPVKEK